MDNEDQRDLCPRERHKTIDFIGLRAHATTVGFLQLCEELLRAGVLDEPAVQRIKEAICAEITVSQSRISNRTQFDETLRRRLDAVFPQCRDRSEKLHVGPIADLEQALEGPRPN